MAQESGFFNAQLVGEEYDRVYLAEQFAAYFASFIGNGVFGKSMQKLEVLAQASPNMSIKVLPGEAWINGWWYRNTDEYTLPLDVADGALNRIDLVVLRWGNQERDIWLHVIKGVASANPTVPTLRRDADYYDLQLASIQLSRGSIKVTQSMITDTRLNTKVCGLVTGVVDQIDTTGLYDQFERYFKEFKEKYEADYDTWTREQKKAYMAYIAGAQSNFDKWTSDKQQEYQQFVTEAERSYDTWIAQQQEAFGQWYMEHTTAWTQEFTEWFDDIKGKLFGDVACGLQLQLDGVKERISRLERMVFTGMLEAPIVTDSGELIGTLDGDVIGAIWDMCPCDGKNE